MIIPFARRQPHLLADLLELFRSGQVLQELVKRDIKVRYKRSVLGLAWTMLNPLLLMVVTTIVFSSFFRFAIEDFPVYFLSGFVVWSFFAQGTVAASTSVIGGAALSRRIYLPPALFPLAAVNAAGFNLLLSLPLLLIIGAFSGWRPGWALVSLPLGLALAALFTCGVALVLAAASVFFHDSIYLFQAILQAWMYLTPLFYPVDIVPEPWLPVVQLNPLFHLVRLVRDPIYAGAWPDPLNVGLGAAWAIGAAAFGWWYFERSRDAFDSYL